MKRILILLGMIALLLTIVPPVLFYGGGLPGEDAAARESVMKSLMMAGTLLWFATAPLWMKKEA